jgi:TolA-binding protein
VRDSTNPEVGRTVPTEALRDAASADVVERVWQRLDAEIEPRARIVRSRPAMSWALAASVATFALGVAVGREGFLASQSAELATRAEPRVQNVAAGQPEVNDELRPDEGNTQPTDPRESVTERSRREASEERNGGWAAPAKGLVADALLSDEEAVPGEPLVLPAPAIVAEPAATAANPPSWQRLANSGEYEAALFELGQDGGFETALLASNAEQLMLLADVARATGQTQRALAALRRIVSEFRGEPVAPLAAYSLGNLLEKSGDARGAAQAFAVYRALSPEGDFAEDALVRQLRSAVERDDRDYAKQLAAQYQVDFPEGRRGEEVSRWVDELAARALASGADAGVPAGDGPQAEAPVDTTDDGAERSAPSDGPADSPEE